MKTLEQILEGGPEAAAGDVAETAPEVADATAEVTEAGMESVAGDGPEGGDPSGDTVEASGPMVPVGALVDERRKRRAAEAKLARQAPPEAGEAPAPGAGPGHPFRQDPEGYLKALEGAIAVEISAVRVDAAESAARGRYPDFDVKARAFARLAAARPGLVAAMEGAPDPAEFAYRVGARALGDAASPAAARTPLPESLSESPSAQAPTSGAWRPKPLSEILGGR